MQIIIKAPNALPPSQLPTVPSLFLAGSIEMNRAVNWQLQVEQALADVGPHIILNPRRDDWDSSWTQEATDPQFRQQVEWELDAQDQADVILMYLAPGTVSPISLLELGLFCATGKMVVCCPEGFQRRGNVEIVCQRHGIHLLDSLDDLIKVAIKVVKDARDPRERWSDL